MRIAFIGPHFAPDTAPTGAVLTRLVTELTAIGHTADVVTSLPWYRTHSIEPEWQGSARLTERTEWGSITRLHPFPTDKSKLWARAAAFGGFTAFAGAELCARIARPDVVFAMSPPLTLGLAGIAAARRWSVPIVFNIQDVFPDVAVEIGAISSPRVIRAFSRVERFCYEKSDAVTVLSDDLAANVRAKVRGERTSVVVIPNFVDTSAISVGDRLGWYRNANGIGDETVVMYAGNIGHSQPIGLILAAARALRDRPDVRFVINGEGVARAEHERQAHDLDNVQFVDFQPEDQLSATLAAGDIHLVLLEPGLGRSSVPSKMYSILAAGRPIVASIDRDTEVDRVISAAGAGVVVDPGDTAQFIDAITSLIDDRGQRADMGAAGRSFVESHPTPAQIALRYAELFNSLG